MVCQLLTTSALWGQRPGQGGPSLQGQSQTMHVNSLDSDIFYVHAQVLCLQVFSLSTVSCTRAGWALR